MLDQDTIIELKTLCETLDGDLDALGQALVEWAVA